MFYLTTHSTHFIYGYLTSGIWLRTILIAREETRCRHMGYSFRLAARVLLYAPSHRQDSTYHSLCYTSRGALAGTRNSSMGPPHEGSIRRPIAPWANALPLSYVPLPDLLDAWSLTDYCYTSYETLAGQLRGKSVRLWCDGSSDRSLMVNPLNRLVQQRLWYVLSCLWDGAYKRTLAVNRKA